MRWRLTKHLQTSDNNNISCLQREYSRYFTEELTMNNYTYLQILQQNALSVNRIHSHGIHLRERHIREGYFLC